MEKEFHTRLSDAVDRLYSNLRLKLYYPVTNAAYSIEPFNKYSKIQLSILRLISLNGKEMLLREVAEYEKISVSNISKILNPMEIGGLIERKHIKGNRIMLVITENGEKLINCLEAKVTEQSMELFNKYMSDEKQTEMLELITALSDFLDDNPISNEEH